MASGSQNSTDAPGTILKRHLVRSHKSEQVIIRSALERKGAFRKHFGLYAVTVAECPMLVVFDGKTLYPLGYYSGVIGNEVEEILVQKFLGREDAVHKIENMVGLCLWDSDSYLSQRKVYAQLKRLRPLVTRTPTDCTFHPATSFSELAAFDCLMNKFKREELGYKSSQNYHTESDTMSLSAVNPLLLIYRSQIVAAVCSNFQSKKISMINTLYVEDEYRNRGFAKLLLYNYVTLLLKNSERVCLFYSPDNEPASHIYKRMGFKTEDTWRMTVLMGHSAKMKLANVI